MFDQISRGAIGLSDGCGRVVIGFSPNTAFVVATEQDDTNGHRGTQDDTP